MADDKLYSGAAKVYMTQGATGLVVTAGGQIDASAGKVILPGSLGKGYIDLSPYLMQARELASAETMISGTSGEAAYWGGLLIGGSTGTTPALALTSSGDQ